MAQLPVIVNDLEGHFCCTKPLYLTYLGKCSMYYLRYVYTQTGRRVWLEI